MNTHYQTFEANAGNVQAIQQQVLAALVGSLRGSDYGRHHQITRWATMSGDVTPDQYAQCLPLVGYEDIRHWIERIGSPQSTSLTTDRTIALFKTSGSTAHPKHIPVTASLMRQKVAAFSVFWGAVYKDYSGIATGSIVSNFIDAGETTRLDSGIELCSESSFWSRRGRAMHSLQRWPLPGEVRQVSDPSARLFAIARLLLQSPVHCLMSLNPSTLLQFCRLLTEHAPALIRGLRAGDWGTTDAHLLNQLAVTGKQSLSSYLQQDEAAARRLQSAIATGNPLLLSDVWPMLQLIICWRSVIVQPYFAQLAPYVGNLPLRDYIAQSSECMMAIPLEDHVSGGALAYTSHFFEFIAEHDVDKNQPPTRFAWQLQQGAKYELVVSTGGGLYRYRTGDCVRVNGFKRCIPIIEFLYRFGKTSSITGEKLTEHHVLMAARSASQECGYQPGEYLCFPCTAELPHYGLLIESCTINRDQTEDAKRDKVWTCLFDEALKQANSEYRDKCLSGRLGPMALFRVERYALSDTRRRKKAALVSDEQVKSEVLSSQLDRHLEFDSATRIPA